MSTLLEALEKWRKAQKTEDGKEMKDVQLAALLGLPKQTLSALKHKRRPLTMFHLHRIAACIRDREVTFAIIYYLSDEYEKDHRENDTCGDASLSIQSPPGSPRVASNQGLR